jgi:AcrR family transcriptional regulator
MNTEVGLRERKKRRTRATISRVALELFSERGYHTTTLADIAEAADVSTRTIFAYFPSKEDILFCDFPAMKDALARALANRPPGKDALETVRDFILSSAPEREKQELHEQRKRVLEGDETLRNRERGRLAQLEELVARAIAQDIDAPEDDLRPQVVAASLTAAFEVIFNHDEAGTSASSRTADEVATLIDPVITFMRGGLEALKQPRNERPGD